jgi:hypothetical protein
LYFAFDTMTAEIVPRETLQAGRRRKAARMIDDLRLNNYHHLKKRVHWLSAID